MTRKNRMYSPELKRQAVEDYLSGMGSQAEQEISYSKTNAAPNVDSGV